MQYFDKHGNEIKAGMFLRMEDGSIEEIYACTDSYGKEDLGINASNDEYLKRHGLGEFDREFYSLSASEKQNFANLSLPKVILVWR